jgi:hypothetical protein
MLNKPSQKRFYDLLKALCVLRWLTVLGVASISVRCLNKTEPYENYDDKFVNFGLVLQKVWSYCGMHIGA